MSSPVNSLSNNQNDLAQVDSQWPFVAIAALGQEGQESAPSQPIAETERLLDIDGLLEIAQLISNIKESGRLETAGEENIEADQANRLKD
jgi:hypothetical protein